MRNFRVPGATFEVKSFVGDKAADFHIVFQAYVEGLRLLGKEFSFRTRAKVSFFRVEVLKRTYKAE